MMDLRLATKSDSRTIFNLRNLPDSIKHSTSRKPIKWAEHVEWYRAALQDENILIYIIEPNLGSIRFNKIEDSVIISIYLWPKQRGRGIGPAAINAGVREVFKRWNIKQVIAYVSKENEASLRAFEKCGFFEDKIRTKDCPTGCKKLVTV